MKEVFRGEGKKLTQNKRIFDTSLSCLGTQKLDVPDGFSPTDATQRGWFIVPISDGLPTWGVFAAVLPGLLAYVLIFIETEINRCGQSFRFCPAFCVRSFELSGLKFDSGNFWKVVRACHRCCDCSAISWKTGGDHFSTLKVGSQKNDLCDIAGHTLKCISTTFCDLLTRTSTCTRDPCRRWIFNLFHSLIVNKPENKLKKPGGYHLDVFIMGLFALLCGFLGLPMISAPTGTLLFITTLCEHVCVHRGRRPSSCTSTVPPTHSACGLVQRSNEQRIWSESGAMKSSPLVMVLISADTGNSGAGHFQLNLE